MITYPFASNIATIIRLENLMGYNNINIDHLKLILCSQKPVAEWVEFKFFVQLFLLLLQLRSNVIRLKVKLNQMPHIK